ncbi:hypothetical protein BDV93DRAFT_509244 [Ceratobasidium sp. AG-I]|nr:hypothetical protein BDV93DRAFT_509244 [Ceratobasidium sp. AG-I]
MPPNAKQLVDDHLANYQPNLDARPITLEPTTQSGVAPEHALYDTPPDGSQSAEFRSGQHKRHSTKRGDHWALEENQPQLEGQRHTKHVAWKFRMRKFAIPTANNTRKYPHASSKSKSGKHKMRGIPGRNSAEYPRLSANIIDRAETLLRVCKARFLKFKCPQIPPHSHGSVRGIYSWQGEYP